MIRKKVALAARDRKSAFVTTSDILSFPVAPAIAKHPVHAAEREIPAKERTKKPRNERASEQTHRLKAVGRAGRTTQRQSTQLDDSSGREHSFATATISSFRMTRYYKTPACDSGYYTVVQKRRSTCARSRVHLPLISFQRASLPSLSL